MLCVKDESYITTLEDKFLEKFRLFLTGLVGVSTDVSTRGLVVRLIAEG